jgi:hypothetical protein
MPWKRLKLVFNSTGSVSVTRRGIALRLCSSSTSLPYHTVRGPWRRSPRAFLLTVRRRACEIGVTGNGRRVRPLSGRALPACSSDGRHHTHWTLMDQLLPVCDRVKAAGA